MTDQFFPDPAVRHRLRTGPLGSCIDTYAALPAERGYAGATAREYLQDRAFECTSRTLSANRPPPGLPPGPLIMPSATDSAARDSP
jgi:hypothetical protein